ncbi:ACH_G0028030.mRNA.1.CDS.1 [Saccharomyces cerevisiae]|nr:Agp3p [Saccharomyces cerevisiae R103]CAI4557583.1 ACH_G0028030.mRNA.1.CDS.1 [Saccharomyces cerevisiae]CAI4567517.1 AGA_1a_G0029550.mRNA.1.CDS.1 [Saccharomyces cerevisiae]CAI6725066.1 ACH_G0028030.mRNA.1.CDS.1 [Saccharomyces cerevisiae]CAI6741790.1 AGA_1a_G0029550.mRNA.1.CDS.1 [Saccharomyces cerevisiae]
MAVLNLKRETVDIEETAKKDIKPYFASNVEAVDIDEDPDVSRYDPQTGVKRALKNRHISLLALGGVIGPGCLVGAGNALNKGGPLALLLGFSIIGIIAFSVMESIGEMITLYPSGGGFTTLARRFHSDALSAVCGYAYVVVFFAVLANEYNTLSSILQFWGPQVPLYGYILIFWFAFEIFQLVGVGLFGETEYWLAWLKIVGLVAYYIFSIVYISGGIRNRPAFGFHYWNSPGALSHGFKGIAIVFVFCSTFYSGTESVALAATESKNPGKAVPLAVRQTLWRILVVYIGIAVFYGATVPFDDPNLSASTKVLKSPIAIAISRAGWAGGAHLVNAFILITCISAINGSLYIGSRTLTHLAHEGLAPKILAWTDRRGVPIPAITVFNALGLISLMNVSVGAANAYSYIVNLSGVGVFIVWGVISYTHLRIRKAWVAQGRSIEELPYKALFYPWTPVLSLAANIFLALIQGWSYFVPFDAGNFVDAYILLPVGISLYIGICVFKSNHFRTVDLRSIDLDEGRRKDMEADLSDQESSLASSKTMKDYKSATFLRYLSNIFT